MVRQRQVRAVAVTVGDPPLDTNFLDSAVAVAGGSTNRRAGKNKELQGGVCCGIHSTDATNNHRCLQRCCWRSYDMNWFLYSKRLAMTIVVCVTTWRMLHQNGVNQGFPSDTKKKTKTILYLNQYWDFPHFQFGQGRQPFLDANCPISNCVARQDTPALSDTDRSSFDAVLIHAADDALLLHHAEISKWRRPHQRFVFMTMESPLSYNHQPFPHRFGSREDVLVFNWTMTYRSDSDLPRPYGFFQPLVPRRASGNTNSNNSSSLQQRPFNQNSYSDPIQREQRHQQIEFRPYNQDHFLRSVLPTKPLDFLSLAERPQKVAWIVSRCTSASRREDYVNQLSRYIQVDILGACGSIPCNQSFHDIHNTHRHHRQLANSDGTTSTQQRYSYMDNCSAAVERDYKFYLAFENSFCQDYVTEKFFRRMQGQSQESNHQSSSSPLVVVLGGANYSRMAPPHSYVNALDFESPASLAAHLHMLDQNKSLYLSYFWWKDHYQVHSGTASDHATTMCRLCEMLHDEDNDSNSNRPATTTTTKLYPSISTWHGANIQCWLPDMIQMLPRREDANVEEEDDDGKLLDADGDDHF